MKSIKLITFLMIVFAMKLSAQNSFVTSGGNAKTSVGSVSYSIGEVVTLFDRGTNGSLNQGVQQPYEISVIFGEIEGIELVFTVYPNPTVKNVTLNVKDFNSKNLYYFLFDVTGKYLGSSKISENNTDISMESLSEGVYFVKVTEKNKDLKTFKILKKN